VAVQQTNRHHYSAPALLPHLLLLRFLSRFPISSLLGATSGLGALRESSAAKEDPDPDSKTSEINFPQGENTMSTGSRIGNVVAERLLDMIFRQKIEAGSKLPSAETISKVTGVSIVSTREAIKNLESIGLVEIKHGKGIFVTSGGPIVDEILEARKVMECQNAEMAASKIEDWEVESLRSLLMAMYEEIAIKDDRAFINLDHEFHLIIARAAGNRFLYRAFCNARSLLLYQQSQVNSYPGNIEVAAGQHKQIIEALAQRSPQGARLAMSIHLDEAMRVWKEMFSDLGLHSKARHAAGATARA